MEFQAYPRTIQDILYLQKQYIVPRFQREYSWTNEHLNELWKDIISNVSVHGDKYVPKDYFIGSLVLFGSDISTEFEIVDGQQRLTTITILFSALAQTFRDLDEPGLADGVYNYVEGRDASNQPFFRIKNETPKPFFQCRIQHKEKDQSLAPGTSEEETLLYAYTFFMKKLGLQSLIKEFIKKGLSIRKTKENHVKILNAIREQILRLKTILITVSEREEAYTIFETLNAKGMDLTTVDLVKNKIFKVLQDEHPTDYAKDSWTKIKNNLLEREYSVDLTTFFRHYWLSKYEFTTGEKLYKSFTKLIPETKDDVKGILKDLVNASEVYKLITNSRPSDWRQQEEKEIYNSLTALSIFRVVQPRSFLLALIEQKKNGIVSVTDTVKCLKAIEKFHFAFSSICSSRASGLEGKYSYYARLLREHSTKTGAKRIIKYLIDDLRKKLPDEKTFYSGIQRLRFNDELTKDKKLIQYIFKEFEKHLLGTEELEISNITIEHILPQSTELPEASLIGNLLPLSGRINNAMGNKSFVEKMAYLRQSQLKTVQEFVSDYSSKTNWDVSDIEDRTQLIGQKAYHAVWKF